MAGATDAGANLVGPGFQDPDAAVQHSFMCGVTALMCISNTLECSKRAIGLARRYPGKVWCTAGVHPQDTKTVRSLSAAEFRQALHELTAPERKTTVIAIGECGFDCHADTSLPTRAQQRVFDVQVAVAKELGLPLYLHSRNAQVSLLGVLRQHAYFKGVVHCFSGTAAQARELVQVGLYISVAGNLLDDSRNTDLVHAFRDGAIPLSRLLVETDAPWLCVDPGRPSCPKDVWVVMQRVAELLDMEAFDVRLAVRENFCRLFGVTVDDDGILEDGDLAVAPPVWQDWVTRLQGRFRDGIPDSGEDAQEYAAHLARGLRMVTSTPWAPALACMRLVVPRDRRCFARPAKSSEAAAVYVDLVELLKTFLLAPGLDVPVDAGFMWRETSREDKDNDMDSDYTHTAAIELPGPPEAGLVLWSRLTEDCDIMQWYPKTEWVLAAFHASVKSSKMVPTVWVAMNLLARMWSLDPAAVPLSCISDLLAHKADTAHYGDLTAIGEALFLEWLDAEARGEVPFAGPLEFDEESSWTDPMISAKLGMRL